MLSFSGMRWRWCRSNQNADSISFLSTTSSTCKISGKTHHERVREWPWLAAGIADIFHKNPGLFPELAHKGMLKVLAGLHKSGNKAKHPGREPWRTGEEDQVFPLHQHDESRGEPGKRNKAAGFAL